MSPALAQRLPVLTTVTAMLVVVAVYFWNPQPVQRSEAHSYDWRVRLARRFPTSVATNLGFVFMSDESITRLNNGSLGYRYGLYWPRHLYGRVVDELTAQGARAIAFDILLPQPRVDHPSVMVAEPQATEAEGFLKRVHPGEAALRVEAKLSVESDDYLAWQMRRSGRVILAADRGAPPWALFATNAASVGDVSADADLDGVLRRARPFKLYREWHPVFRSAAADYGVDLDRAVIRTNQIILTPADGSTVTVALDAEGCFKVADFVGEPLPPGLAPKAKPFTDRRVWHLGIVLAAAELGLNLDRAIIRPEQIFLPGETVERIIPLAAGGWIPINWALDTASPQLRKESIDGLIEQQLAREAGGVPGTNRWRGALALVGSSATGNDLTDRGATSLGESALLVGQHWNLANSVITGNFIRPTPREVDLSILLMVGALTSWLTWRLRAGSAAVAVLLLAAGYVALAAWLYVRWRIWVPLALPVIGAGFFQHVCLVTYRVIFEEGEKRKVRAVFAKVVSPNVVHELLQSEKIAFGGALREITVLFADVRGFTQLTDRNRSEAEAHIREQKLAPAAATAYLDQQARDTLNTVNLYLAAVADVVKQHTGTLDKYIGDCVMAFWGAPTPNTKHAVAAVEAAVDAQRAIYALNVQRETENQRRAAAGQTPLALLNLGSGLNTGVAIVGLMGSDQHILNYTVFGREVNLASRLEGVSGRGRVIIGETTYQHLLRDAPSLAARCRPIEPTTVKGIAETLTCYEVPWQQDAPGG